MSFIIIYVTHPDEVAAKAFSDQLLQEKLIACANFFPINSSYWWKGQIESEGEHVSLLKTSSQLWPKVLSRAKELHPYNTPCIIKIEAEANTEYEQWIHTSVLPNPSSS